METKTNSDHLDLDFTSLPGDQCVVWDDVTWEHYSTMLRAKGDRTYPKMVYLDGSMWLMTSTLLHEFLKSRLGRIVNEVTTGNGIRCVHAGSTTFRRRKKKGGFEADQSYYLEHAPQLRNREEINLRLDPPPDLIIEVAYTHAVEAIIAICRRFRVPEMWICDAPRFRIFGLGPINRYAESLTSRWFPLLAAEEIHEWLHKPAEDDDETRWTLELRRWVADVLAPRVREATI